MEKTLVDDVTYGLTALISVLFAGVITGCGAVVKFDWKLISHWSPAAHEPADPVFKVIWPAVSLPDIVQAGVPPVPALALRTAVVFPVLLPVIKWPLRLKVFTLSVIAKFALVVSTTSKAVGVELDVEFITWKAIVLSTVG